MKNTELFLEPNKTLAQPLLESTTYPWEILGKIKAFILEIGSTLSPTEYDHPKADVWIAKDAVIAPTALIGGPAIIGSGTEVRHCAFIRGSALIGKNCVVGNSTELKNCILFDHVQVPHYNYVGDAILGHYSHMGAGSICSNVKSDKTLVTVKNGDERMETGLKKFSAILGDHVEVGCNSVLCPGTVILPHATVYPLSRVRGVVPAGSIYKCATEITPREQR